MLLWKCLICSQFFWGVFLWAAPTRNEPWNCQREVSGIRPGNEQGFCEASSPQPVTCYRDERVICQHPLRHRIVMESRVPLFCGESAFECRRRSQIQNYPPSKIRYQPHERQNQALPFWGAWVCGISPVNRSTVLNDSRCTFSDTPHACYESARERCFYERLTPIEDYFSRFSGVCVSQQEDCESIEAWRARIFPF